MIEQKISLMSNVNSKEIAEVYDKLTESYFNYKNTIFKDLYLQFILKKRAAHILELGVGTGNAAIELIKKTLDLKITGIDSSEEMLKIAEKKNKYESRLILLNKKAEEYVVDPENRFDAIYMHSGPIIAHFTKEGLKFSADSPEIFKKIIRNCSINLTDYKYGPSYAPSIYPGQLIINIEAPESKMCKVSESETYVREVLEFGKVFHRKHTYLVDEKKLFEFELKSPLIDGYEAISIMRFHQFQEFRLRPEGGWFSAEKKYEKKG